MKDYRLKGCEYAFYIVKNVANKKARIRDILLKGEIEGNETETETHLITPILECLMWVKQANSLPQLNNELWGIGIRITALDKAGIKYEIQDCQDCVGCKVLTIPRNYTLYFSTFDKYDIVVLCPTEKDREGIEAHPDFSVADLHRPCMTA